MRTLRHRMRSLWATALTGAAVLSGLPADAATRGFLGTWNNDWSNPGNWSLSKLPTAADTAVVDYYPQVWLGARPGAAGSLFIGLSRYGSLYVATGLNVGQAALGGRAGTWGNLMLSGSSARMAATGAVTVGQSGGGEIDLYKASSLKAASVTLGSGAGAFGKLVIGGQSALTASGALVVGDRGAGVVDLNTAGSATADTMTLGRQAGGSGSVSVSGGGTKLTVKGALTIGEAGSATLIQSTTSKITAGSLRIGGTRGGRGTLGLSGGTTALAVSGAAVIGGNGEGAATLYTGSGLSAGSLALGEGKTGKGTLTAGSAGTALKIAGTTAVGGAGSGTLRLQDGAVLSTAGLVIGRDAGSSGSIALSGSGTTLTATGKVEIGRSGRAAALLTGGARLLASTIDIAANAGSSASLSIGAAHGSLAKGAGTLNASAIRFGAGSGALVFNLGGPTYTLGAALSGRGTVFADAGNVVLTGNSSAFTGKTVVSGGSLAVNGQLGGTVSVGGYGTLAGTGTVGTTAIAGGGTIAPGGASTGTLSVAGNLSFAKGSHYQASVNPAADRADRLSVSGATTIAAGSTLDVVQASAIALSRQDVILSSGGGISGRFDRITSNYAFVTPTVATSGGQMTLTLRRNDVHFASLAARSASAVAAAADALPATDPLAARLLALNESQAAATFSDLNPTVHASPGLSSFDVGRFARMAGIERSGAGADAPDLFGTDSAGPLTPYAEPAYPGAGPFTAVLADERRNGPLGWARVYGGYSSHAQAEGDRLGSTGGLLFGWDMSVADSARLGLLGGIGRSAFRESAALASGSSDDYTLGIYGNADLGGLTLRGGLSYVRQNVETTRDVRFNNLTEHLSGAYGADALQAYVEAGRSMRWNGIEIEPFANLALTYQHADAFTETGGSAALSVSAAESWQPETTIGLRAARRFDLGDEAIRLRGMLGWNHTFAASGDAPVFAFANGSGFAAGETGGESDSAVVQAGIDWIGAGGRSTVGLTYDGSFGSGSQTHMVKLTLSHRF